MATWAMDLDGGVVNLDRFERVVTKKTKSKGGATGREHYAEDAEGNRVPVCADPDQMASMARVVPAQPGFYVVEWWPPEDAEDKEFLTREPVIAWGIDADGEYVTPITVDGGLRTSLSTWTTYCTAVLDPDGRVYVPQDTSWNTFDEWVESCRDWQAKREAKAAAATASKEEHPR